MWELWILCGVIATPVIWLASRVVMAVEKHYRESFFEAFELSLIKSKPGAVTRSYIENFEALGFTRDGTFRLQGASVTHVFTMLSASRTTLLTINEIRDGRGQGPHRYFDFNSALRFAATNSQEHALLSTHPALTTSPPLPLEFRQHIPGPLTLEQWWLEHDKALRFVESHGATALPTSANDMLPLYQRWLHETGLQTRSAGRVGAVISMLRGAHERAAWSGPLEKQRGVRKRLAALSVERGAEGTAYRD